MIDLLLSFFFEFLVAALLMLSPSRIIRRLIYKTPLSSKPKNFANRIVFIVIDCIVWACIALFAIVLCGI